VEPTKADSLVFPQLDATIAASSPCSIARACVRSPTVRCCPTYDAIAERVTGGDACRK